VGGWCRGCERCEWLGQLPAWSRVSAVMGSINLPPIEAMLLELREGALIAPGRESRLRMYSLTTRALQMDQRRSVQTPGGNCGS